MNVIGLARTQSAVVVRLLAISDQAVSKFVCAFFYFLISFFFESLIGSYGSSIPPTFEDGQSAHAVVVRSRQMSGGDARKAAVTKISRA